MYEKIKKFGEQITEKRLMLMSLRHTIIWYRVCLINTGVNLHPLNNTDPAWLLSMVNYEWKHEINVPSYHIPTSHGNNRTAMHAHYDKDL